MLLNSQGVSNGIIAPRFGKYADAADTINTVPTRSLPLVWEDLPKGTISLALVMQDYDAIPVCGFSWIHWLVANISPADELPENASRTQTNFVQGKNSLSSQQICGEQPDIVTNFYGGPRPPDTDHEYEITMYALDTFLEISPGFRLNELRKMMRGHVLDTATLCATYKV